MKFKHDEDIAKQLLELISQIELDENIIQASICCGS